MFNAGKPIYALILVFCLIAPSYKLGAMEVSFNPDSPESPLPKIGNFRLRSALQPFSLFGTQQTIVDKGDILLFQGLYSLNGVFSSKQTSSGVLYGITDSWSAIIALPAALEHKFEDTQSSGVGDLLLHTDVALYKRESSHSYQLWTALTFITLPTGNSHKVPPVGLGYPTLSVATTFSHTTVKFYCATSFLGTFNTSKNGTRFGNQFCYDYAMGYNWGHPLKGILVGMLEFSGIHIKQSKIDCVKNPLSGGNVLFLGPSLFCSFARFAMHMGIQFPILQRFNDPHERYNYRTAFIFNWVI